MSKSDLRPYEAVVIMHPDSTESDQKALFARNKGIIESFSGKMNHLDTWGKRQLANPIRKARRGIYFHTTFEGTSQVVAELERTMRINDKVLRFCHTRLKDGTNLTKFLEGFRQTLSDTANREREREAKIAAKKAASAKAREEGFSN